MPLNCQSPSIAAGTPLVAHFLPLAERDLVDVAELEHVGDVEIRIGAVPIEYAGGVPTECRPVAVIGLVDAIANRCKRP